MHNKKYMNRNWQTSWVLWLAANQGTRS